MAAPAGSGAETHDNSLWAQVMAPQAFPSMSPTNANESPSLLPVPYQPQRAGMFPQSLMTMPPGLPAIHTGADGGALIPAPPTTEPVVHIPPMYTKPRPIIPRYRAISGLLSVLIVFGLLCAGAGYYAKVTGKLAFVHYIIGDARAKNMPPSPVTELPIPSMTLQQGPAFNIIPSATTASKVAFVSNTVVALNPTNQFKVNQAIYLTYSVHPRSPGTVTLKWYTNSTFFNSFDKPVTKAQESTGYAEIQFSQPLEGKVEIYWNNELAVTLLFVVEPD
ncbi:MAG TPA: hypothetical protein VFA09_01210 [Ktedonobacteraceae bacterium]|nr:hypothetical protein [Ktedonobacteraceae bacterium]